MLQDCCGCVHCYIITHWSWDNPEEIGCKMMDYKEFSDDDWDLLDKGECPHYQSD